MLGALSRYALRVLPPSKMQVESWALRIVDTIRAQQVPEDGLVELKAEWPTEPGKVTKMARRLAGHANFARGEPILWLVGLDERSGVVGAPHAEVSNWHSAIVSHFDGEIAPDLVHHFAVTSDGISFVAMLFDTSRAPYVVRNPLHGQTAGNVVEWEVPWREGTKIRTARREDLVRLLAPLQLVPTVEAHLCSASQSQVPVVNDNFKVGLWIDLYVTPRTPDRVVLPFHDFSVTVEPTSPDDVLLEAWKIEPKPYTGSTVTTTRPSRTIVGTDSELIIDGPGMFSISALFSTKVPLAQVRLRVTASMRPAGLDRSIVVSQMLRPTQPGADSSATWAWRRGLDP